MPPSIENASIPTTWNPSFDCGKTLTNVAAIICASKELSEIDQELAQTYNSAWKTANDKQALLAEQIAWQKEIRDACTDMSCILQAYKFRLKQLGAP